MSRSGARTGTQIFFLCPGSGPGPGHGPGPGLVRRKVCCVPALHSGPVTRPPPPQAFGASPSTRLPSWLPPPLLAFVASPASCLASVASPHRLSVVVVVLLACFRHSSQQGPKDETCSSPPRCIALARHVGVHLPDGLAPPRGLAGGPVPSAGGPAAGPGVGAGPGCQCVVLVVALVFVVASVCARICCHMILHL